MKFAYVEPTIEQLNSRVNMYTTDGVNWISYAPTPEEYAAAAMQGPAITMAENNQAALASVSQAEQAYQQSPPPLYTAPQVVQPSAISPLIEPGMPPVEIIKAGPGMTGRSVNAEAAGIVPVVVPASTSNEQQELMQFIIALIIYLLRGGY